MVVNIWNLVYGIAVRYIGTYKGSKRFNFIRNKYTVKIII